MEPQKINRYEIKSEIGRGGMAIVYKAHDPRFKRDVAIKVLPREFLYDSKFRARFEREAQAIASLEHLAIVPVYDFGEEGGQPFLVMRYMPGGSLADRIKGGTLSFQEAERIITHLAPALDEAHAKGIIHRDLKPGNILFDQHGNPYLSDFGIVKIAEATASLTGTGLIGTPAYMSPEQVVGEREIDSRSDIYALGVILFQMLTGKLPFEADTPIRLAFKHVNEPVPNIRDMKPDLPAVCDEVIVRTMAKDADERYQTAGELAKAFSSRVDAKPESWPAEAAVQDETPTTILEAPQKHPLPPKEPRAPETLQPDADMQVSPGVVPYIEEPVVPEKEADRRGLPTWVVIGGLLAVLLLVGGVGGTLIKRSQDAQATRTVVAMAAAETKSAAETETARPTETPTATITHTPSPTMTPNIMSTQIPTITQTIEPTLLLLERISIANTNQMKNLVNYDYGDINHITWSSNGELLAVASKEWIRVLADGGRNELWAYEESTWRVFFRPDDEVLITDLCPGLVFRDALSGREVDRLNILHHVSLISPDGLTYIRITGQFVHLLNIYTDVSYSIGRHSANIEDADFHPDGNMLATIDHWDIRFWSVTGGLGLILEIDDERLRPLSNLAFSSDGDTLAVGEKAGRIWLVSKEGYLIKLLDRHEKRITALAFHPSGLILASGDEEGQVNIWNVEDPSQAEHLGTFVTSLDVINVLEFSLDESLLVLGGKGSGSTLQFWGIPP